MSATTRHPRPGEVDGRQYHFVDDDEFDRLIASGALLEWARFAGNRYGTPREPLYAKLEAGVACLLEIDLAGARQVKSAVPDARLVFLAPPSWAELVRRLTGRGTEPAEVLERRLAAAREELAAADEFEVTLVNTSVQDVCRQLVALMDKCDDRSLKLRFTGTEGRTWQALRPTRSPTASSTRRSTNSLTSWTASTGW